MRNLVLVLGDQLDLDSAALDGFDPDHDRLWMAEVQEETGDAHQLKLVFFLSAMRHYASAQRDDGRTVDYHALTEDPDQDRGCGLAEVLHQDLARTKPKRLVVVKPGDYRVQAGLQKVAERHDIPLEVRDDGHFYTTPEMFSKWAKGKKSLVLEYFYRHLRRTEDVLMDDGEPIGGEWNFDRDNRETFGRDGPPSDLRPLPRFDPDAITREVIALVEARFADNPGQAASFGLPVTREGALRMLDAFIEHGLPNFGRFQDAMAEGDVVLYHSRVSALLNVKLLDPRDCVNRAVEAHRKGKAPLNSVEGFVRQILGWREFIRGVYWRHMPDYAELNELGCHRDLPSFFWDGETDMACVADSMQGLLQLGYAHHIHRLMVLGLFSQLWGAHPYAFHEWHMKMYVDAVDWVSLPNTLGMSQYGDGGIVGTKPYVATGKYIQRMGPYCRGCRYDPKRAEGERACPFTTLYWDFLARHREQLRSNQRLALQLKNVDRKSADELERIHQRAQALYEAVAAGERI
jgi:deoxyribodipyrimidine photolyase-related protein